MKHIITIRLSRGTLLNLSRLISVLWLIALACCALRLSGDSLDCVFRSVGGFGSAETVFLEVIQLSTGMACDPYGWAGPLGWVRIRPTTISAPGICSVPTELIARGAKLLPLIHTRL